MLYCFVVNYLNNSKNLKNDYFHMVVAIFNILCYHCETI